MARALQFGLLFSLFKKCALPSLYEYFFKNDGEIWLVLACLNMSPMNFMTCTIFNEICWDSKKKCLQYFCVFCWCFKQIFTLCRQKSFHFIFLSKIFRILISFFNLGAFCLDSRILFGWFCMRYCFNSSLVKTLVIWW